MSIESRAAMSTLSRMEWSNLGIGMAKFEPNWPQLGLLVPKLYTGDLHELTAALSHLIPRPKGVEAP